VRVPAAARATVPGATADQRMPLPPVSERERIGEAIMTEQVASTDLEMMLRRVIREEAGWTPAVPAEKWRGGTLVLKPGNASLQEKCWPIETFFHKIVKNLRGVSEETTTGVHRLYEIAKKGELPFWKSKFWIYYYQ
jgi:S-adenosylhomocysteine hydrolase